MGIIVNVIGCETVYILISSSFSPLSYKGGANFGFAPPLSLFMIICAGITLTTQFGREHRRVSSRPAPKTAK